MSHLYPDIPAGQYDGLGVRSEDLQCMTLDDNSIDVFVTQDVLEHVANPDAAFRDIARVLVPGGVHIWTVPIYARDSTVRRAEADGDGGIRHLLEPDYHGNPLGGGALVFHEWGADITDRVDRVSGMHTERHSLASRLRGIAGEMSDVLVSRNP